jgi:type II secretory pathway pseudopilin PulG
VSRWSEPRRPSSSPSRDDGFSLIEVVVALGILMVLVTTLLPQLVVGIRSTTTSRLVTQAKGMAQAELERMRNLPYHVSYEAGNFRDVLDYYYKDLGAPAVTPDCTSSAGSAPPVVGWTGYVSPTAARCSYEPEGAFYRTVKLIDPAEGIGAFTIVTSTRFLSGTTPPVPVTPASGYDTQSAVNGEPVSAQIGATVTVLYTERATLKPTSISTQIARQPPLKTRMRAQAGATAVELSSVTPDTIPVPVTLTAGLLNLTGSLAHSSNVISNLAATSSGLGTGEEAAGASRTTAAPPSAGAAVVLGAAGSVGTTGCNYACWAPTRVDAPAVSAADGLPIIGSPAAPAQSLLTDKVSNAGISFGNSPTATYRPELELLSASGTTGPSGPLVRVDQDADAVGTGVSAACALATSGTPSFITTSGYLTTSATGVESCAVARASSLSLFPTTFAPRGVVLIELRRAAVQCQVTGSSHVATMARDYEAVVQYWDGTKYVTVPTIAPSTTDPLNAIPLATTATGGGKMLGDYIESWSGLTSSEVVTSTESGSASVSLPGVISITTQGVRTDSVTTAVDPGSAVALTVGALSCSAMDAR